MSFRLQWIFCICLAIAFGSTAFAQAPDASLDAALVPSTLAPVTPILAIPAKAAPAPAATAVNTPMNGNVRLHWLLVENLGAGSLLDNLAVGGVDTLFNTPKEYGTHWSGYGERVGMVTANYGVKSTMEAGLGSLWGEDPRYFRTAGLSTKSRMAYVVKMTFLAYDRSGNTMPAYSRYLAMPGSSFLSNTWQPKSDATATEAVMRVGLGFLSRMGENAWKEFVAPRH